MHSYKNLLSVKCCHSENMSKIEILSSQFDMPFGMKLTQSVILASVKKPFSFF